ncbi:MAG TPA: tellurite resistance TerB family protein [Vicinamibacterales bacterium]|nr:tellurite resistance TerB family protein [Vicinamibacterales bacterium]
MARTTKRAAPRRRRLAVDEALLAVLIAAMNANEHVSAAEAERAHNIIWSMRRFRRRSGETVGRLIQDARALIEAEGEQAVVARAARTIPAGLRAPALAVAADLVLEDGTMDRAERTFLAYLTRELDVDPQVSNEIIRVMKMKNGA